MGLLAGEEGATEPGEEGATEPGVEIVTCTHTITHIIVCV